MISAEKIVDAKYKVNENINPGDDFYKYVCDNWKKEHPLPKVYGQYSVFDVLVEENEKKIFNILDELSKKKLEKESIEQKIYDLYSLGIDMKRRNNDGVKDLKNIFLCKIFDYANLDKIIDL